MRKCRLKLGGCLKLVGIHLTIIWYTLLTQISNLSQWIPFKVAWGPGGIFSRYEIKPRWQQYYMVGILHAAEG